MKNVLILGAGQSTPYMINYMLENAEKHDWFVTVCDMDISLAKSRVNGNTRGTAIEFDVNDEVLRKRLISESDIVLNLLAPQFQYMIALDCLHFGKHVVTASYTNLRVADLNNDAMRKGMIILNEMGLDPGIDHMSAMAMIHKIRENGGYVAGFVSYGGGLPAPDVKSNPLDYCITWNPRNVIMAGRDGAQYMEDSQVKILSHQECFQRTWNVEIDGVGTFEAYPNRDSLIYLDVFNLKKAHTMLRGTLRYPGWSETWEKIIKLGLPNDTMVLKGIADKSYAEFIEMFLPLNMTGSTLEARVARYLNISPTGKIMDNLKWLGLFSTEKIGKEFRTTVDVMTDLVKKKMPLPEGKRDMVILRHEIEAVYPNENNRKEKIISTMIDYGVPNGFTAIAKTVGAPAAIAAKLILNDELPIKGTHIPIQPVIYKKVMAELETLGIKFEEEVIPM